MIENVQIYIPDPQNPPAFIIC